MLAHLCVTCWSVCDQDQDFDWWNLLLIAWSSLSEALDHLTYSGSKKRKVDAPPWYHWVLAFAIQGFLDPFISRFRLSQESEPWDYWSLDWFLKRTLIAWFNFDPAVAMSGFNTPSPYSEHNHGVYVNLCKCSWLKDWLGRGGTFKTMACVLSAHTMAIIFILAQTP